MKEKIFYPNRLLKSGVVTQDEYLTQLSAEYVSKFSKEESLKSLISFTQGYMEHDIKKFSNLTGYLTVIKRLGQIPKSEAQDFCKKNNLSGNFFYLSMLYKRDEDHMRQFNRYPEESLDMIHKIVKTVMDDAERATREQMSFVEKHGSSKSKKDRMESWSRNYGGDKDKENKTDSCLEAGSSKY